jgi:type I restriction enzyme S subunit
MGVVRFDEIAKESRGTFRGSLEGVPVVGLEHIEPYDMLLNKWDVDVETTFTKAFHKGEIMFGRRRAYQHKACVATCDGICSGDITLIEPVEGKVYPDLLPFIVQNDDFFEHAIKGSNGALSPRVKWEHMASFEVNLPSLAEQKVLAEKLWAAYEVKQSYLKMIAATEEMVKSQFIEMFGKVDSDRLLLSDIADVSSGLTKNSQRVSFELKMPYLRVANVFYNKLELDDIQEIGVRPQEIEKTKLQENDLLFVEGNGSPQEIGRVAIWDGSINPILHQNHIIKARLKISSFSPAFLMYFFMYGQGRSQIVRKAASSSGLYTLSLNKIASLQVPAVELEFQQQFVSIAHQADKSISELRKSIDAIDKVIKSLINENL